MEDGKCGEVGQQVLMARGGDGGAPRTMGAAASKEKGWEVAANKKERGRGGGS